MLGKEDSSLKKRAQATRSDCCLENRTTGLLWRCPKSNGLQIKYVNTPKGWAEKECQIWSSWFPHTKSVENMEISNIRNITSHGTLKLPQKTWKMVGRNNCWPCIQDYYKLMLLTHVLLSVYPADSILVPGHPCPYSGLTTSVLWSGSTAEVQHRDPVGRTQLGAGCVFHASSSHSISTPQSEAPIFQNVQNLFIDPLHTTVLSFTN